MDVIYNKALQVLASEARFDTGTFGVILVGSSYTPIRASHDFRSHVIGEIAGTGYVAGGVDVAITITRDDANGWVDVTFAAGAWAASTLTARRAVYFRRRGGAPGADELVFCKDFGVDVVTDGGTFNLHAHTVRMRQAAA